MKNFFKKLAFVLALAMVVTAIAPAAKASAATEPTFKYSGKVLYIGGDKTGVYGETYRFKFNNGAGYTATWKSSKPSVATVDAKTGEIQAVAVGTTTITATLTNKADNTVECTAKVVVKQNAEKIGFGTTAAVKDMAVGDTGKVNVYRQVGTTKVWKQADKTVTTDVVKWTSSNPEVATVSKWGVVTAVAAGEATITATATQSEGTTAVVSKSYKVTVKAGLVSAKQASTTTIAAVFAGDLSAVANTTNVAVYQIIGTTKVAVPVKSIKFDDTDKTKATITLYNAMTKDTEYVVEYAETSDTFKGADTSADAVASITVSTTEVVPNDAVKINFKAFDANGVDITSAEILARIDVALVGTSTDAFLDTTAQTITFWAKDKAATVKASFHTYKFGADFNETLIEATQTIVSKETVASSVTSVGVATITAGTPDYANPKTNMSIDDQTSKLYIKTKDSADKDVYSKDNTAFTFTSSDEATLLVTADGSLYPVKSGVANVIVKYNDSVLGAVTVTIGSARKIARFEGAWNKSTLSMGVGTDNVVYTVKAFDQFGDAIDADITFAKLTAPSTATVIPALSAVKTDKGVYTVTVNGEDVETVGTYQYKIDVSGIKNQLIFTVGDAKNTVARYEFDNLQAKIDTTLKFYDAAKDANKTDSKVVKFTLSSYASNGYKVGEPTILTSKADATSKGAIYVEVKNPKGETVALATDEFISVSGNKIVVEPIAIDENGVATKLAAGTYSVSAYEMLENAKGELYAVNRTTTTFTVADAQVAGKATMNNTTYTGAVADIFATEGFATLKVGDTVVNGLVDETTIVTVGDVASNSYAVKTVKIELPVKYGTEECVFMQEIAVGLTVRK